MVYIINGEVVQDNDPRVAAMAARNAGASSGASARMATLGASGVNQPSRGPDQGQSNRSTAEPVRHVVISTAEPLRKVEEIVGLKGKKVKLPSVFGRPSIDLPLLYVMLIAILMYMGGPRAGLPILALGYFLTTSGRN